MPVLYLVATPIGNLEDVTFRAARILKQVGLIAAEDTRTTRKLLAKYGINGRLVSYHRFSGEGRVRTLLKALESQDVALVSEAGTPVVSDPGYELVRTAVRHGVQVVPLPGPSAVTTALMVSGLPATQFIYLGFLPRRTQERRRLFSSFVEEPRTVLAFEAPHRLRKSLEDLAVALGERPLVVCRELTKLYEEIYRGDPAGALTHFVAPRGEFTLVIGGFGLAAREYWESEDPGRPARAPRSTTTMIEGKHE